MTDSLTWKNVAPGANGARTFMSQMLLDKMGMTVLTPFFHHQFQAQVDQANAKVQMRGVDICVRVAQRSKRNGPVGIDAKVDGGTTGNMAIELLSQDRPNTRRAEAAEGYIAKDSTLVAYYFPLEGKLVVLNMVEAYPWLNAYRERLIANPATPPLTPNSWMSATPNDTYLSYNLIVPVSDIQAHCPGVVCLDLVLLMGEKLHTALTGTPLQKGKIVAPSNVEAQLDLLTHWLETLPGYDVKPPLSADDKERLIRVLEPRSRFKNVEEVRIKGKQLQANRVRRVLPEDGAMRSEAA
jgi:hypothetical protein